MGGGEAASNCSWSLCSWARAEQSRADSLPPSLRSYAIADNAYRSLRTERKDQCILISGESGAGKTEATKKILQYYAVTCPASEQVQTVKDRLLQSNPVLEVLLVPLQGMGVLAWLWGPKGVAASLSLEFLGGMRRAGAPSAEEGPPGESAPCLFGGKRDPPPPGPPGLGVPSVNNGFELLGAPPSSFLPPPPRSHVARVGREEGLGSAGEPCKVPIWILFCFLLGSRLLETPRLCAMTIPADLGNTWTSSLITRCARG